MNTNKKYGLFIPKKSSNTKNVLQHKPSVFGNSSDEEENPISSEPGKVFLQKKKENLNSKLKTQTQIEIEKALAEDPNVYDYDEIYDDMQEKKKHVDKKEKMKQKGGPKYISALIKHAENRKKEQERRIERQVQKEREQEGGKYADKEQFVTGAYKKKLLEMKEEEAKEKHREMMEDMMDVTKQKDLSGFYRHFLNQQVGEEEIPDITVKTEKNEKNIKTKLENSDTDLSVSSDTSLSSDEDHKKTIQEKREGKRPS